MPRRWQWKAIVIDNRSRDYNTTPQSEITDDSSIESDEENIKIYPSNLRTQTVFNTSNINIEVDMAIADAGATGKFSPPGTPIKNIKQAEKPLCINLLDGKQIKSTHTCHIYIPWIPDAATRAYIVTCLDHTSLISIKMLCDSGWKVEYDASKCRVIFKHIIVWKGRQEPTTGLWVLPLDPKHAYPRSEPQTNAVYATLIKPEIKHNAYTITSKRDLI